MRRLAALTLLITACGSGVYSSEPSAIRDGQVASGYPAATLIDARVGPLVGQCAGAIIAPRVALTVGHCVHDFASWSLTMPYAVGAPTRAASRGETFDWNVPATEPSPELHDVGLLYLDEPVVLDGYPALVRAPLERDARVRYIGRVDDGAVSRTDMFIGGALGVRPGADYGWPHTFATAKYAEPGDSGGPVVLADAEGMIIAGVDSGGSVELDVQLFARLDEVAGWIDERVASEAR